MLTVVSFVVALGLLIAVHEYGHYRLAVACGVKVLRFSIGFGKPLFRWKKRGSDTEFVLAALPLGGYVRMLDEREAPVDPAERHLAFNTQPLKSRAAIVAAGPLANLFLAVLLYATVNWTGVLEPKAILGTPVAGSIAAEAGLTGGDWVARLSYPDDEPTEVASFDDLRWQLTQAALDGRDVTLWVAHREGGAERMVDLKLSALDHREADAAMFRKIGIMSPYMPPLLGKVVEGKAAAMAGLQSGDRVLSINGEPVQDAVDLRRRIERSVTEAGKPVEQTWAIRRANGLLDKQVTSTPEQAEDGRWVGRIGAYIGEPPEMLTVRYGPLEGLVKGAERTWEVSWLTLRMMGRMVIGEASIKNISGPLTIAEYAGKSAEQGMTQFLVFLALISVSLGVLNLLPLPVLDGGHLMYYLWEGVTGKSVSDAWMERLQRGGIAVLFLMMSIALFNDLSRLFG